MLEGKRRSRGQSIAEFALVAPLLIILLLGAIDFGRLMQARVTSESAVRAGAAWGATNLQTARQPLLPVGVLPNNGNCGGGYQYSPTCNVLAQACLEAAGFPDFSGGTTFTGSGGNAYQTCTAGSAAQVCNPGPSQSNPYLSVTWTRNGTAFTPSDSNPPDAGDHIIVTGSFCFKTLANYPVIPTRTTLLSSSEYTVQQ